MMGNTAKPETTSSNELTELTFGWTDYILFGGLLGISVVIGAYFGCFGKKQDNTVEYLMGGKTMKYFPVAMSLIASHLSGISLLGLPSEVYHYGTQYAACIVTTIFTCLVVGYVYLPIFYKLQLNSVFEYLEVRFARPVRVLASFLYTFSLVTYIPMVLYVPALAFAQATAINIHLVTLVIGFVCIFYTTIGGLKAVVWADTVQLMLTIGSLFSVMILGILAMGNVSEIIRIADEGGRLIFWNMDPSPFARNTFWGMSLGMTFTWVAGLGVSQGAVQRFLSVPTITDARKSILCMSVGMLIIKFVLIFTGLTMYAKYHDCDPVKAHVVTRSDQILPYYVIDVAKGFPGLPGLFLAGLVSAGLSTMSASLNTCAGTIYEDFINPWLPESSNSEARAATIMKLIVVVLGVICVAMVFIMDKLGDIFQVSLSLNGITAGGMLGIFSLGALVPWTTTIAVMIGGSVSLITMTVIVVGAQWSMAKNTFSYDTLPLSTENCWTYDEFWNDTNTLTTIATTTMTMPETEDNPFLLYTLSFMYYTLVGTLIVVVVGLIVTFIVGSNDIVDVDPDHFPPFIQRYLPPKKYTEVSVHNVPTIKENINKNVTTDLIKE